MSLILGEPTLFGPRDVVGVETSGVVVRPIDKLDADAIIRAGHYSRSVVWSSNVHLGVFYEGRRLGAMQFGPAMNPASGGKIVEGATVGTWLELNRLWLSETKPANTATRALAGALRFLRHVYPTVEWVQSFADERCGKWGGVYQAASFIYCGSHTATFYEIDGEWFHKSMKNRPAVDKRGWGQGPKIAWFKENEHRAVERTFRQFRYLKFLCPKAQRRLLLPVLSYPKPGLLEAAA